MSNLKRVNEQITNSWKMLQLQWATTKEQWRDKASERFEKEILQEFEPAVREVISQLNHLEHLVEQARREIK